LGVLEFPTTGRRDDVPSIEFNRNAQGNSGQRIEAHGGVVRHVAAPIEYARVSLWVTAFSTESLGAIVVTADALSPLEALLIRRSDTIARTELSLRTLGGAKGSGEWLAVRTVGAGAKVEDFSNVRAEFVGRLGLAGRLVGRACVPLEIIAALSHEALPVLESLTGGARVTVAGISALEWADPPTLVVVSPERVIRSPGRIRILAGPGSTHPLRGQ
jgi:hypothetical protein